MKSEMYTKYADQYALAVEDNIYNAHFERPSLQALLGDIQGTDVLDLGCGSGVYAEYFLTQQASSVTCIDMSEKMIEIVRSKLANSVKAYSQDLSVGLPVERSESVDIIVCPLMLHYIEDLSLLFKEVYRVLRNGGYMVFSTHHPFADFEYSSSGNYFEREQVFQHWGTIGKPVAVSFYRRSLTELISAVTSSGLVVSQISEGEVSEKIKELSPDTYQRLTTRPNFIFVRCHK